MATFRSGGGRAIDCYYYSYPTLTNCTISANSAGDEGGAISCYDNSLEMTNCILWWNTAPSGHEIALLSTGNPLTLVVRYSDVQGGAAEAYIESGCTLDLDATNIDADPKFVLGALGGYYLSQTSAGQPQDSPCADSGSDTAANLGLDTRTTRNDNVPDAGTVDMGYHYPVDTSPRISWIEKVGDDVTIVWEAEAGVSYTVEYCSNVEFGSYTQVPVGETDNWTDIGGGLESQRYYRLVE